VVTYLWIALGSALGGMARFWLGGVVAARLGAFFPWGTILVNISGSFLIGLFAATTGPDGRFSASSDVQAFLLAGICGGYTTFSAFSLQTLNLAQEGEISAAGANIAISVVACLIAVWLGYLAGASLNPAKGGL